VELADAHLAVADRADDARVDAAHAEEAEAADKNRKRDEAEEDRVPQRLKLATRVAEREPAVVGRAVAQLAVLAPAVAAVLVALLVVMHALLVIIVIAVTITTATAAATTALLAFLVLAFVVRRTRCGLWLLHGRLWGLDDRVFLRLGLGRGLGRRLGLASQQRVILGRRARARRGLARAVSNPRLASSVDSLARTVARARGARAAALAAGTAH